MQDLVGRSLVSLGFKSNKEAATVISTAAAAKVTVSMKAKDFSSFCHNNDIRSWQLLKQDE
jgi:hypothetical protein